MGNSEVFEAWLGENPAWDEVLEHVIRSKANAEIGGETSKAEVYLKLEDFLYRQIEDNVADWQCDEEDRIYDIMKDMRND